jgi:hypothetical protein
MPNPIKKNNTIEIACKTIIFMMVAKFFFSKKEIMAYNI